MDAAGPSVHDGGNGLRQHPGASNGSAAAQAHQGASDRAGMALLTEHSKDAGQVALARGCQNVGGGWSFVSHAHVERTVVAK